MTIEELNQLYYLKKLIARNKEKLQELQAEYGAIGSATDYSKERVQTSLVKGSKVEDLALSICELTQTLALQNAQFTIELARLERYINSIDDGRMQLIFKLRFVDCKRWSDIATVFGDDCTESAVRKLCTRYLDSHPEKKF